MKKSTNFNQGRNPKHRGRNAFVNLAIWAGVPDDEILESVKKAEKYNESHTGEAKNEKL